VSGPILDEDAINNLLKCDANVGNIPRIQAAAVQTLLDIYDRKVTRGEFINMASACVTLHAQCAKLFMLASIEQAFSEQVLDANAFITAHDSMADLIGKQMITVSGVIDRVKACPTDQDPVH
jgi:hypothetical protein